ncbi:DUF1501 domain-containing protein [Thalassotalea mangrovi]|uniref:DUF1501 domain-containing protein n=1 Tax=Thalassotalea mangrovi TaxID=2572245 RepID=A0A4U1B8W5_9GAMM|nr:DUF1501 domain-containing protein [Thalassotalea mangrovi]TKB47146.1 DUF1501 domain-containing protein [Thalassotalea mangrovi]
MRRRQFIKALSASLVTIHTPLLAATPLAVKSASNDKPAKLVWVIMRGALDSLHTVVPTFEPDMARLRPNLYPAIKDDLLAIDNGFGFHPAMTHMHSLYKKKQLLVINAVSSGFGERSHFDGQDFLESGLARIDADSGWLGRAAASRVNKAIAVSNSVPISLRGYDKVTTWYPSRFHSADSAIFDALQDLYQSDSLLSKRLAQGLALRQLTSEGSNGYNRGRFVDLAKSCGKILANDQGTDCAMLEVGGWDTHNYEIRRQHKHLVDLNEGLQALQESLGEYWDNTVVIMATEFGRTVKENGTLGTDHGTASCMFMAGGAVAGGQVLGEWPGLSQKQRFEGRDLAPTSNTFSWIASILSQHWRLDNQQIAEVFPQASPYRGNLIA